MSQTADEIVAKYVKTVGGIDKIEAVKSLRRTGKVIAGGGFEIPLVEENKRPNLVRQDITIQGLTGISAYDGKTGWKVQPWSGKKDAEAMGEGELKGIIEESDFDGPLVNYKTKGNKVEFVGMDEVEGTELLRYLVAHATRDEFTVHHDWRSGDIAFWDNRCTQHRVDNDFGPAQRRGHRVAIDGDAPYLQRARVV
jgi:hypothetical protein